MFSQGGLEKLRRVANRFRPKAYERIQNQGWPPEQCNVSGNYEVVIYGFIIIFLVWESKLQFVFYLINRMLLLSRGAYMGNRNIPIVFSHVLAFSASHIL